MFTMCYRKLCYIFIYIKNAIFTRLYNRRTDPLRTDINYKILLIINYFHTKTVS